MGTDKRTRLLIARDNAYREYTWAQNEAEQAYQIFTKEKNPLKQAALKKNWGFARSRAAYLRGRWQQAIAAIQALD